MFKQMQKTLCALAVLSATATSVMAADSVDVKVIGTVTPAACTPILSGGGVVDYGSIKASSLSADDYTVLSRKDLDFSINCDAPVKIAIKPVNNRPNTTAGNEEGAGAAANSPVAIFGGKYPVVGLGMDGQNKIGGYGVGVASSVVDGNNARLIFQNDGLSSSSWYNSGMQTLYTVDSPIRTSWSMPDSLIPVAVTNVTSTISVQAYLNKGSELDLSHDITIDGLTTIEMVYL